MGNGTATAEQEAAEKAAEAEKAAAEKLLYPEGKTEEKIAAEKKAEEEKKAAEGKTEEEVAAEKKAAEEKAEAEKKEADKKAEEEKEKLKQADVVKAEDLKFPDGIQKNEVIEGKFLALVNDKDMKAGEKAQALIALQQDLYIAQQEAHKETVEGWVKEVAEDKEIIGDTGEKLEENLAIAKKGMEALKVEGLSELLHDTGFGSHPLFVKAFYRVGTLVSEDSFVFGGGTGVTRKKSQAEIMYGSDDKK